LVFKKYTAVRYFFQLYEVYLAINKKSISMKKVLIICCLFIGLTAAAQVKSTNDPAEKAKGLQKELKLSDGQTDKIAAIYKESAQKFAKLKAKDNGDTNKIATDVAPLREATIKKIKAVLTPKQSVKYDKLVKQSDKAAGSGWSDGWSPTTS
jgi:periplasmic protein CpxP/Spy